MQNEETHDKIMGLVGKHIHKGSAAGISIIPALRTLASKNPDVEEQVYIRATEKFLCEYRDQGRKVAGFPDVKRDFKPDDPRGRDPWTKYKVSGLSAFVHSLPGSIRYNDATVVMFQEAIEVSNKTITAYETWNEFHRLCIAALKKKYGGRRVRVMSALPMNVVKKLFEEHYPERQEVQEAVSV